MKIGIDSNCVSYLIDAWSDVVEPTDLLAEQRKALFRTYLYLPGTFYVTPQTRRECSDIPDEVRRTHHENFFSSLLDTIYPDDEDSVISLTNAFFAFHPENKDCRMLAEAIVGGLDILVSFDARLVDRLSTSAVPLRLLRPSDFWTSLCIPKGAKPHKVPAFGNPLSDQTWWRW